MTAPVWLGPEAAGGSVFEVESVGGEQWGAYQTLRLNPGEFGGFHQERLNALMGFRFTERQARLLVPVLQHSGVFMGRHYAAFAGIAHVQKVPTSSNAC